MRAPISFSRGFSFIFSFVFSLWYESLSLYVFFLSCLSVSHSRPTSISFFLYVCVLFFAASHQLDALLRAERDGCAALDAIRADVAAAELAIAAHTSASAASASASASVSSSVSSTTLESVLRAQALRDAALQRALAHERERTAAQTAARLDERDRLRALQLQARQRAEAAQLEAAAAAAGKGTEGKTTTVNDADIARYAWQFSLSPFIIALCFVFSHLNPRAPRRKWVDVS